MAAYVFKNNNKNTSNFKKNKKIRFAKVLRGQKSSAPFWNVYEAFCYLSIVEITLGAHSSHMDTIL